MMDNRIGLFQWADGSGAGFIRLLRIPLFPFAVRNTGLIICVTQSGGLLLFVGVGVVKIKKKFYCEEFLPRTLTNSASGAARTVGFKTEEALAETPEAQRRRAVMR